MVKASIHRQSILALHQQGVQAINISRRLKVSTTISRFKELGSEKNRPGRGRPICVTTRANIKKVRDRIYRNPARSTRKMGKDLTISKGSMARIMKKHLKMKGYNKQGKRQFLSEASKTKRKERSKKLLLRFKGGGHKSILFTDEKVFTVEQSLNKQNDRVYATSQPNVAVRRTGYPKSVMVFAGITSDGKTPLIFVPQGIKINGNNYLDMLKTEIVPSTSKSVPGAFNRMVHRLTSILPSNLGASRTFPTSLTSTSGLLPSCVAALGS